MHSILLHWRLVIKYKGLGGEGRKNSFYEGLFNGILPLLNEGGSPKKLGGPCIILQKYEGGSHKTSLHKK